MLLVSRVEQGNHSDSTGLKVTENSAEVSQSWDDSDRTIFIGTFCTQAFQNSNSIPHSEGVVPVGHVGVFRRFMIGPRIGFRQQQLLPVLF